MIQTFYVIVVHCLYSTSTGLCDVCGGTFKFAIGNKSLISVTL